MSVYAFTVIALDAENLGYCVLYLQRIEELEHEKKRLRKELEREKVGIERDVLYFIILVLKYTFIFYMLKPKTEKLAFVK